MVLAETFSTADLSYDSPPACLRLDILLVFSSFVQVTIPSLPAGIPLASLATE